MFVIGPAVNGGLYGAARRWPASSSGTGCEHHVDFRSLFGTVLDGWLGGGASTVLNGSYENLGFFRAGPGARRRWHATGDRAAAGEPRAASCR